MIKIIKKMIKGIILFCNTILLNLKIFRKENISSRAIEGEITNVDSYWNQHTVAMKCFSSVDASIKNLEWRFSQYPLFKDYMSLWGSHKNQIILDYGCGPGNDLIGFALYSRAKKIIGVDISERALKKASDRLKLHNVKNVELIKITDEIYLLPFEDNSIDFIYCQGVLHHTSHPYEILKEFKRILKDNGEAIIMVYNKESAWYHLFVPYVEKIINNKFKNLSDDDAFQKTTDGENCPIARPYNHKEFSLICEKAGFEVDYKGGYFSLNCLDTMQKYWELAKNDKRLHKTHRNFLNKVEYDGEWYYYEGKTIGIGGVYKLIN
jgi:ubiquinone/menaquinone biosynthesis C-methylase UbiE